MKSFQWRWDQFSVLVGADLGGWDQSQVWSWPAPVHQYFWHWQLRNHDILLIDPTLLKCTMIISCRKDFASDASKTYRLMCMNFTCILLAQTQARTEENQPKNSHETLISINLPSRSETLRSSLIGCVTECVRDRVLVFYPQSTTKGHIRQNKMYSYHK